MLRTAATKTSLQVASFHIADLHIFHGRLSLTEKDSDNPPIRLVARRAPICLDLVA